MELAAQIFDTLVMWLELGAIALRPVVTWLRPFVQHVSPLAIVWSSLMLYIAMHCAGAVLGFPCYLGLAWLIRQGEPLLLHEYLALRAKGLLGTRLFFMCGLFLPVAMFTIDERAAWSNAMPGLFYVPQVATLPISFMALALVIEKWLRPRFEDSPRQRVALWPAQVATDLVAYLAIGLIVAAAIPE